MKRYKKEESMLRVIWIGIQNWIFDDFNEALPHGDDIDKNEYDALVRAYNSQNLIGWDHFLEGKTSKAWNEFYSLRLSEGKEKNGRIISFGKNLVDSIWMYTLDVWRAHNESVHGKRTKYSDRDAAGLKQCVDEIYNLRQFVSTEDEWLFHIEVRRRKEQSFPQIVGWLQRVLICFNDNTRKECPELNRVTHTLHRVCTATIYS